jgi:hypothetical protein
MQLFSYETSRKIITLMFWMFPCGFLFVVLFYVLMALILFSVVKSVIIFITSYLAISLIIIMAPLFISFALFERTRSFFDNWLKQLVNYFIQPLVILAFAFFMLTLVRNQMEFLIGYRVCWKEAWRIPVLDIPIFMWQTDFDTYQPVCLYTPNALMNSDGSIAKGQPDGCIGSGSGGECRPYACQQKRYLGYPYLDPSIDRDKERIRELQQGRLLSFKDILVFILLIVFLLKFNKLVPQIAKELSGADLGGLDLSKSAKDFGKTIGGGAYTLANTGYKRGFNREGIKEDLGRLKKRAVDTVHEPAYDAYKKLDNLYMDKIGKKIGSESLGSALSYGNIKKQALSPLSTISNVASKLTPAPHLLKVGAAAGSAAKSGAEKVGGIALSGVKQVGGMALSGIKGVGQQVMQKIARIGAPPVGSAPPAAPGGVPPAAPVGQGGGGAPPAAPGGVPPPSTPVGNGGGAPAAPIGGEVPRGDLSRQTPPATPEGDGGLGGGEGS